VLAPVPPWPDALGEFIEPCAAAEELPRLEPPVLEGAEPMAVEPDDGAPMAVLPGVVGPEDEGEVLALEPESELLP